MRLDFAGREVEEDESLEHDMTLEFELDFINLVNDFNFDTNTKLKAFPNTERSYDDISDGDVNKDLQLFFVGYVFVAIYVSIMLGNFNHVEARTFLALAGILTVVLGLGAAFGICSYAGLFSSNMNQIMPFLVLGIGIDDMFVIVQNFDNLKYQVCRRETRSCFCVLLVFVFWMMFFAIAAAAAAVFAATVVAVGTRGG